MRIHIKLIAFTFVLASLPTLILCPVACGQESKQQATDDSANRQLRLLTYNIHHGEGIDRKLDLERIAKVILSVKPDLVALQEVDVKTSRTGKVDQAKTLAELTKMKVAFGPNIEFGGGQYGNAILSRFPIVKSNNVQLPNHRDGEQRGLLQVEVKVEFLQNPVSLWATHFDHRGNDSERVASAELVNQQLPTDSKALFFLAGDFNDVLGSSTLNTLEKRWNRSNSTLLPTVPVGKPVRQIDFVWSNKSSTAKCVQTKVLTEAVASDHRAVLAVYLIQ